MARPKKTRVDTSEDSIFQLLQEVYNDCQMQKERAVRDILERKTKHETQNIHELYELGKINNESLKLIDSVIDKKIALIKQISAINAASGKATTTDTDYVISENDKDFFKDIRDKNK